MTPPPRPHWWQWPTILSLDAPLVVLAWQSLLATAAGVSLGWPERVVLGVSVWLAYAADRWFEGWRLEPGRVRTPRHRFYQRHRWPVSALWILLLAGDVTIAALRLHPRAFLAGVLLLLPVAAYLLSHQLVHRDRRWRAPKEVCVAFLLGGGAALFIFAAPAARIAPAVVPLALFMMLCFANVALISTWEHEIDVVHGQTSLARQYARAANVNRLVPWVGALVAFVLLAGGPATAAPAAACAGASCLALAAIDRAERRVGWAAARVLADAALLTPLVPLLLRRGP